MLHVLDPDIPLQYQLSTCESEIMVNEDLLKVSLTGIKSKL